MNNLPIAATTFGELFSPVGTTLWHVLAWFINFVVLVSVVRIWDFS